MRIRPLACVLLLVSSFCVAQEWEQSRHSAPAIIVNGVEVTAGPFAPMLEAFSKAFNPGQDNVRWPLYAYSIGQLGSNFCQEHGEELSASAAAFVGPVSSGLIDRSPRYTGIQITDTSWFIGACMELVEREEDFEQVLDGYLSGIEGFGEYLRDGRLERLPTLESYGVENDEPNPVACVRQLMSGSLSDTTSADRSAGLWWQRQDTNAEQDSMRLTWSMATDSAQKTIPDMIASLKVAETWQFTPRDPGQFGGHFLISFTAPQEHPSGGNSSTSLWNISTNSNIEWEEMSGDNYYRNGSFDMWYFPPFCGAADDDDWYLVSQYRLGLARDLGFRANLIPLRSAAVNAAH